MVRSIKQGKIILILTLTTMIYGCLDGDLETEDSDSQNNTVVCTPEEPNADYQLTFESTWSASTHPDSFPSDPHFSGLIGATHNFDVTFWKAGETASSGIENMAETGDKSSLTDEIETALQNGTAHTVLSGGGIGTSPGSVELAFQINQSFPLVTIVSMLAPSPDWFVGTSRLTLCKDNAWVSGGTVNLYAFDAGTDSGENYTSPDNDTNPKEPITPLENSPFQVNDIIPVIGIFTFIKL